MRLTSLTFIVDAELQDRALVGLDLVKSELSISGGASDDALSGRIEEVSALISGECNRAHFAAAELSEIFTVQKCRTSAIWPRHWPVTAVESVTEDGTALDPAAYRLDEARRIVRLDATGKAQTWQGSEIVVTYDGGYELPDTCPPDLRRAALTLVTASWVARGRDPMLKAEDVPGIGALEYWIGEATGVKNGIPADVAQILSRYRNDNFAG